MSNTDLINTLDNLKMIQVSAVLRKGPPNKFPREIHLKVMRLLIKRELTRQEIADQAGVSIRYVHHIAAKYGIRARRGYTHGK